VRRYVWPSRVVWQSEKGVENPETLLTKRTAQVTLDASSPCVLRNKAGILLDFVPDRRIVTASTMRAADHCISASLVTIELADAGDGTLLTCTHHGVFFEGADGPQLRELGWNKLMDRLGTALT